MRIRIYIWDLWATDFDVSWLTLEDSSAGLKPWLAHCMPHAECEVYRTINVVYVEFSKEAYYTEFALKFPGGNFTMETT